MSYRIRLYEQSPEPMQLALSAGGESSLWPEPKSEPPCPHPSTQLQLALDGFTDETCTVCGFTVATFSPDHVGYSNVAERGNA